MKSRFLLAALLAAVSSVPALAETVTPADDSRAVFIGRTEVKDGTVSFDWSATYVRLAFEGNYLAITASDTRKDYFNVWIDSDFSADPDKVICVNSKDTLVVIADAADFKGSRKKQHTVMIQKRTEGDQGIATIASFHTNGQLLQAEPLKSRLIEFVGDSYTCGYGSENSVSSNPYTPETQNPAKAYGAIIARYFGADYMTISHSGQGIARNYNDSGKGWHMPDRYAGVYDNVRNNNWTPGQFVPAMTMIYLGTNDFSTNRQPTRSAFKQNYMKLIRQIKKNYGDNHPILCVSSKADPIMFEYVREIAEDCGYQNVYYDGLFEAVHLNNDTELGADWHPNYKAHKKLAYALIPYISTITGWEITDKTVE